MFANLKIYNQELINQAEQKSFVKEDSYLIMKRAALACAKYIDTKYDSKNILVLCGPGNNGGDGILIAKYLIEKDYNVRIYSPMDCGKSEDSSKALSELNNKNIFCNALNLGDVDLVIDALFGFNLNKPLSKNIISAIEKINDHKAIKLSIDVASGLYCDNGHIDVEAFRADTTLTFHRIKPCHVLHPGKEYSGSVKIIDIGLENLDKNCNFEIISPPEIKSPHVNVHKYKNGELYIVASEDMVGASKLATLSASQVALKSGIGIVKLLVKEGCEDFYRKHILEEMLIIYKDVEELNQILFNAKNCNVVFGCGIKISDDNHEVLEMILKIKCNLVLDASAFSVIEQDRDKFINLLRVHDGEIILTPHQGEFKRVFKTSKNKINDVMLAAKETNNIVLYKGNDTVISSNNKVFVNYSTSSYLATAGSGDVLSGLIGSLLAQGYEGIIASTIGCYLHSMCALEINKPLSANDLIQKIPDVIKKYSS
ncbi:MAG: hypothetical protein CMD90_03750 [Gammaproteobacteria bacterium]|nr:hypothetical protein [Gammaproteobacteria bacterium]